MNISQQKSSTPMWINEDDQAIPYNRVTKYERNCEKHTAKLAKAALEINTRLVDFKSNIQQIAEDLYQEFLEQNNGKAPGKAKGGLTLYNFDRSIKIEVSVQDSITFDENLIQLAKDKLDEVLEDGLNGAKDFVKPIVMAALSTKGGKLDIKNVLGLRRYEANVKDPRYAEAMALISKAIRKPKSKEYYRVWIKDESGKYVDVKLNFSAI